MEENMNQERFYEFRQGCANGVLVNKKYRLSVEELKDVIDCIVVDIMEIDENSWQLELSENIEENNNIVHIEKI
jgi:hypothetical protein